MLLPRFPAQNRLARRLHFVEPRDARRVRRGLHQLRILLDFARDRAHGGDEQIQFFARLALRGLDHQRAVHDEREADRVGMEAVIDEPLGDVAGLHAASPPAACR